jgi:hypothetical protein
MTPHRAQGFLSQAVRETPLHKGDGKALWQKEQHVQKFQGSRESGLVAYAWKS